MGRSSCDLRFVRIGWLRHLGTGALLSIYEGSPRFSAMSFFKVDSVPLDDGDLLSLDIIGETRPTFVVPQPKDAPFDNLEVVLVRLGLQVEDSGEGWWCNATAMSVNSMEGRGHVLLGAVVSGHTPELALGAMLRKIETGKGWKNDDYGRKWAVEKFGCQIWSKKTKGKRDSNNNLLE